MAASPRALRLRTTAKDGTAPRASARVSREELVQARPIWIAQGLTYVAIALCTFVLALILPTANTGAMLGFAMAIALLGVVFLATQTPPPMHTLGNHASLVAVYGSIGVAELVYAPDWTVPLGATMFTGALIAMRLTDRRQITAHLVAATILISVPAAFQTPTSSDVVGVIAVLAALWILTGVCVFVLEEAESQGRQLEVLLRRDPLTGAGNQLLLDERLEAELRHHAQLRHPLSLIAIDLAEFSELNEQFGRTACDELLGQAAAAITAILPPGATLARPHADEFWIVLPGTDTIASKDTIASIRWALAAVALPTQPVGLAAAVGVATYPHDGVQADGLVELARGRMVADRESGHYVPLPIDELARPRFTAVLANAPGFVRGLSRAQLAVHPMLWRVAFGTYAAITALLALIFVLNPGGGIVRPIVLFGTLGLSVLTTVHRRGRPALGGVQNHVFLASTYCGAVVGFWALQPDGVAAIAVTVFVAPLVAVRLQSRAAIAGHLAAMSVIFVVVAAAGIVSGDLTRSTILTLLLIFSSNWSFGVSCMVGLELAEEQGRELERLVWTDPVTGVGNRHVLDERLTAELEHHRKHDQPLSIVLLELVEIYENSRGASEELLQAAARTIEQALGPDDDVIRRRGHEFVLILPNAPVQAVGHTLAGVDASLADLARRGHRMETVHVMASYPDDGDSPEALLATADARLTAAHALLF